MPCPSTSPKWFGTVQIVLDGYQLFWSGQNDFGQVQIRFFLIKFYNLDLSKMIWTWSKQIRGRPKWLVLNQNYLDVPKSFWTHRRTRHKSADKRVDIAETSSAQVSKWIFNFGSYGQLIRGNPSNFQKCATFEGCFFMFSLAKTLFVCNRGDTILCSWRAPADKRKLCQSPINDSCSY